MTTSKILVPAGTNIDGTKDRVPVDIEIPQPLHVVIDGDSGGGNNFASYMFNLTPMLSYLSIASDVRIDEFSFLSTDDPTTNNINSGFRSSHLDNANALLMAEVGHTVGCSIMLSTSSDPSSLFGSFEVEDSSDQQIISGPITWTYSDTEEFWHGEFSFELSEDFHPLSQNEHIVYNVRIVQPGD